MIYLDNNATTRPADVVVEAMARSLREGWANPSSIHRPGQQVRAGVELARNQVAQLLGCEDREIVFTSGGSEAANLALRGSLDAQPKRQIIVTSRLEHSAVRELATRLSAPTGSGEASAVDATSQLRSAKACDVIWLGNDERGVIDLSHLQETLNERAGEIAIVSIMWANNETGVIQPIEQIGAICREHGVVFHTDATQYAGKHALDFANLPIDLLSGSAHKFHGPKGIGFLAIRRGVRVIGQAMGGPQERQRRGGTENVPGIVGMGAAAERARTWIEQGGPAELAARRDRFESILMKRLDNVHVNPPTPGPCGRLCNTSNLGFAGCETEAILLMLSECGVCASGGAACSSGSLEPSPVLQQMNLPPDVVAGSIRFSLCRETTDAEIDEAAEIIIEVVKRLRG